MRKQYITSLKGIACLLVAIGHFLGTITNSVNMPLPRGFFDFLSTYKLSFIIDANFYLYLFFIVSGYLVARTKVKNFSNLIINIIARFLRLALPVFFACLVIFLLALIFPFYNDDTKLLFENSWLQSFYSGKFSFFDVLLSPFNVLLLKKTQFNAPYWVLRSMLLASVVIYAISFMLSKIKHNSIKIFLVFILLGLFFFYERIIFACIVGATLYYYEDYFNKLLNNKFVLYCGGIVAFILCIFKYFYGMILIFSWLVLAIPLLKRIKNVLEVKLLTFIGDISFGIYSFHWPIFCSIGCMLLLNLWKIFGIKAAFLLACVVSLGLTIFISILFNRFAEKLCGKLVYWIKDKLSIAFNG